MDPVADSAEPLTPPSLPPRPQSSSANSEATTIVANGRPSSDSYAASITSDTDAASTKSKRSWFKGRHHRSRSRGSRGGSDKATIASSSETNLSRMSEEDDLHTPLERTAREDEWRLSDDIRMQLDL